MKKDCKVTILLPEKTMTSTNYRSVTLGLFPCHRERKFLSYVLILYFPQTFVYFSGFRFAHLARLLAAFCIFSYLGEKLPNTHGLGSFARTASSYTAVITRHFELNLKLVFTGFYTVLTIKNASKVVRQGISFASRRHAVFCVGLSFSRDLETLPCSLTSPLWITTVCTMTGDCFSLQMTAGKWSSNTRLTGNAWKITSFEKQPSWTLNSVRAFASWNLTAIVITWKKSAMSDGKIPVWNLITQLLKDKKAKWRQIRGIFIVESRYGRN